MGGGSYSTTSRSARASSAGYYTKSADQIFSTKLKNEMNPKKVKIRESRDSVEHPNSLAIMVALDVTGSMGKIPEQLVKDGLPNIMETIINAGISDPQLMFLGIGDHECDDAPLQVSQFESSDALLDKWLTSVYLEGGGGGNGGESYLLAWYFAAKHTSIDCFEKRNQKGILFTIGDEPVLNEVSKSVLKGLMGDGEYKDYTASELLKEAQKKYHVFHLHIAETSTGKDERTIKGWKELMGKYLLVLEDHEDVPSVIAEVIKRVVAKKAKIELIINAIDKEFPLLTTS